MKFERGGSENYKPSAIGAAPIPYLAGSVLSRLSSAGKLGRGIVGREGDLVFVIRHSKGLGWGHCGVGSIHCRPPPSTPPFISLAAGPVSLCLLLFPDDTCLTGTHGRTRAYARAKNARLHVKGHAENETRLFVTVRCFRYILLLFLKRCYRRSVAIPVARASTQE